MEDFRAYLFHNIYFWQFTSVSIIFLHITVIWRRNLTHVIDYYCYLFSTKNFFLIIYTTHLFFIQRIRQAHALLIKNKNDYVCGMRKLSSNIEHTPVHQSYYFSVLYLHLKQIFLKKDLTFSLSFHFFKGLWEKSETVYYYKQTWSPGSAYLLYSQAGWHKVHGS